MVLSESTERLYEVIQPDKLHVCGRQIHFYLTPVTLNMYFIPINFKIITI